MGTTDQTTQQLMFSLIEIWKDSGMTQQGFCREKEINFNKFQYWLRRYKRTQGEAANHQAAFARIRVKEQTLSASFLELVFPQGHRLVFYQPVEASFLRSLLQ